MDPAKSLAALDALDLRAQSRVSAVVGVPLRQLRQKRDVTAFAISAPHAAVTALLELLAQPTLDAVVEELGDHADHPSYDQLVAAIDTLSVAGTSDEDLVALLCLAVGESFPAAAHCRRLLAERSAFWLPDLPAAPAPSSRVTPKVVAPEIREQRRARREEERRKKKQPAPRPTRRPKVSAPPPRTDAAPAVTLAPEPERRAVLLTPLERELFDATHALAGSVVLVEVPFDARDPSVPEMTSKERPALVVAGSSTQLLVRPLYSQPSPTRDLFSPWRRLGLDHLSYVDHQRVPVTLDVSRVRALGRLTDQEWNALG